MGDAAAPATPYFLLEHRYGRLREMWGRIRGPRAPLADGLRWIYAEHDHAAVRYPCLLDPSSPRIRRLLEEILDRSGGDVAVMNSLLAIYGRWGRLRDAMAIFRRLGKNRDAISWTAMITAFAQHGDPSTALDLFRDMDSRLIDRTAMISVLGACSNLAGSQGLAHGRRAHAVIAARGFDHRFGDALASNALIAMYGKCGSIDDAKIVFDGIPSAMRSAVSWNSAIQAYAAAGCFDRALELYRAMDVPKKDPTFAIVLGACSSLDEGMAIHREIVHGSRQHEALTGTSLVQMYGRVGDLPRATAAFRDIRNKTAVSWNVLLAAYSNRGYVTMVAAVFREMNLEGTQINGVTFVSLLQGSNKSLDHSVFHFREMEPEYGVVPSTEHYGCMIDSFGRAGELDQAQDLIETMPFYEDAVAWMSFLCACAVAGELRRALHAADRVVFIQGDDSAPYTLLSNMFVYVSENA